MPRCACAKSIMVVSLCICHSVYLYVCNSDFSKVAKNQVLVYCMYYRHSMTNISKLIVLDLSTKALFNFYGVICSPRTQLWHVPDSTKRTYSKKISLQLQTIQQVQLLAAKLCSKQASLYPATITLAHAQIVHMLVYY